MKLSEFTKSTEEWKTFLKNSEASIIHTPQWKTFIEKTYKNTEIHMLTVIDKDRPVLLFPYTVHSHPVFGKNIISCGNIEYGGFAGNKDKKYIKKVLDYLSEKYKKDFQCLEIRQGLIDLDTKKLKKIKEYSYFITKLGDSEDLWKRIDKQKRKAVRKAEKSGVVTKELKEADIKDIYSLYLKNMKRFGSPPVSISFFENFWKYLVNNDLGIAFGSFYKDRLIAVLIGYCFQGRIHIIINVHNHSFQDLRPNDAVHWKMMEWGCKNKFRVFDWGRVRSESSQYAFKKRWASEEKELYHYYLLWNVKEPQKIDPNNPRYKLFIMLWKHLPTIVSRRLGPWLREGMGI